jgi:integrase
MDMGRVTLVDYVVGTWCEAYASQLSPKTWMHYRQLLHKHILPSLGPLELRAIRPETIARWQAQQLAAGHGRVSVRYALTLLGAILQRAFENGQIQSNPARAVRKAALPRRSEVRPLAPATIERMRAASSPRDAALISVLAYAGLRPGEALALQWRDVREQTILVERAISLGEERDTKTAAHRTVRVLQPLAVDLREWRLRSGRPGENTLIFPSGAGTPWTLAAYRCDRRRPRRGLATRHRPVAAYRSTIGWREGKLDSPLSVQDCGVEDRHVRIFGADQQSDLGAAEQDALGTSCHEVCDHGLVGGPRAVADDAQAELVVDDVVDDPAFDWVGYQNAQPVHVAQPSDIEVLLHRVGGGDQPHGRQARGVHRVGGRVGDVEERDRNGG